MACGVALKRSLELDPLLSPESSLKRRRTSFNAGHCPPFRPTFSQPSPNQSASSQTNVVGSSSFESCGPKISSEELDSYLLSEIRSLRRRRLLPPGGSGRISPTPSTGSSDSDSEHRMDSMPSVATDFGQYNPSPSVQQTSQTFSARRDHPLFTYKQVQLICERLLKEQETRLRQEYDQLLNTKLDEQYDMFRHYVEDQIHRRFSDAPMSYLS